ncbi:uncharacterized protein SCHCODRAFT_02736720 [Schizophyllum commune H4-8]|nr:uncharacterized protein SCHCODRAFT_02736720 [Schizophyllum commune H4-8]KAI5890041.1 hypothetical protein SCHCODRAFT_02736720 [Schizophyllum commune H4-8]
MVYNKFVSAPSCVQTALFMAAIPVLARRASARWLMAAIIALNLTSTIGVVALFANHLILTPTMGPHPPDVKQKSYIIYLIFTTGDRLNYIWSTEPSNLTLTFSIPVLVTNLISTSLVGVQVWRHRRDIKASLGPFSTKSRVGGALMFLLESGLAYITLCTTILIFDMLTQNAMTRIDSVVVFRTAIPLLASLYPLIVVLIISVQQQAIGNGLENAGPSYWESIQLRVRSRRDVEEEISTELPPL